MNLLWIRKIVIKKNVNMTKIGSFLFYFSLISQENLNIKFSHELLIKN